MLHDGEEEVILDATAADDNRHQFPRPGELAARAPANVIEWGLYPSFWNVVPVTALMLLQAPRAAKHLPGCVLLQGHKPVRRVELCGIISEVVVRAAYVEGKMEDATGSMNLRWSVDEEELLYGPTSDEILTLRATIKQGAHVIVTGKINEYRGEVEVLVDYIRLIKGPAEATLFEEYVGRVHGMEGERFVVDPGFTVLADPGAYECLIAGERGAEAAAPGQLGTPMPTTQAQPQTQTQLRPSPSPFAFDEAPRVRGGAGPGFASRPPPSTPFAPPPSQQQSALPLHPPRTSQGAGPSPYSLHQQQRPAPASLPPQPPASSSAAPVGPPRVVAPPASLRRAPAGSGYAALFSSLSSAPAAPRPPLNQNAAVAAVAINGGGRGARDPAAEEARRKRMAEVAAEYERALEEANRR